MAKAPATGLPTVGIQHSPPLPDVPWKLVKREFDKESKKALRAFRREIKKEFEFLVQQHLSTSAEKYLSGTSFNLDSNGVTITVEGWFPVAVEQGGDPFDLKPGFLRTRINRVIPIKGKFLTVSVRSRAGSWWHPGIEAKGIFPKIEAAAPKIAERTVEKRMLSFLARIGI